jgi:hypothetical protein
MKFLPPLAVAILPLLYAHAPASAQINPFRSGRVEAGLSPQDTDILLSSVNQLNRRTDIAVGTSESWSNPATGSHGTSSVTGLLERSGMACHRIQHEVSARRAKTPRQYDLTWCLTQSGEWKIAE